MKIEELLEYLDLETGEQFEHFEDMANLVEADFQIPSDTLFILLSQVDMETFSHLLNHYFEEILESVPQDAAEFYTLLETVKLALTGMASHMEEDHALVLFADEFSRFRNWYSQEKRVSVDEQNADGTAKRLNTTIRDALTLSRIEKLGGAKHDYDFDSALDFQLDHYIMHFADLMAKETFDCQDENHRAFH